MQDKTPSHSSLLASILPLTILFVLIQAASLIGFFHFSFHAVEEYVICDNLKVGVDSMQTELDRITSITLEWAAWNETFKFVKGQNPNYITDNSIESTMQEQKLDVLGILDAGGNPVWTRCTKTRDNKPQPVQLKLLTHEHLQQNLALWNHKHPDSALAGYCSTEGGIVMFCSRPIVNSTRTGPIGGTLIMGRFLCDNLIASLTHRDCRQFEWWNLSTEYARKSLKQYLSQITRETPVYTEISPHTATAYTILPDIHGKDAILIKFAMPNHIDHFKKGWLARCVAIYGLEGLAFIAYLASFTHKHCRQCRHQITQQTIEIIPPVQTISIKQIPQTPQPTEELLI